jgi:hypothetical protein
MSTFDSPRVSTAKFRANRRNARLSTGPRTPDGKAKSSQNAVTHGLFADDHVILPGESKEAHDKIYNEFFNSIRPTDATEAAIVERMTSARWKLRRLRESESALFERQSRSAIERVENDYRCKVLNDYKIKKNEREILHAQSNERCKNDWAKIPPGRLLLLNDGQWEKLAQHEKRLEDAFYKAVRELRLWRKEKRANAACGFPDQVSLDDQDSIAPDQTPVSQNEPTEEKSVATSVPSEPCDAPPFQVPIQAASEVTGKLPANPIQPIPLDVSDSG